MPTNIRKRSTIYVANVNTVADCTGSAITGG